MLDKWGTEIPYLLRKRPLFKGFLIPYTAFIKNGIPDFKVIDPYKIEECILDGLCAICGQKLGAGWIAFIGGERSMQSRCFTDPAMHEPCARYSAVTCPYLKNDDARHVEFTEAHAEYAEVIPGSPESLKRPKCMGLMLCKGFTPIRNGNHWMVMADAKPNKIDWDVMPESKD